jgi:hypothetical protein
MNASETTRLIEIGAEPIPTVCANRSGRGRSWQELQRCGPSA